MPDLGGGPSKKNILSNMPGTRDASIDQGPAILSVN